MHRILLGRPAAGARQISMFAAAVAAVAGVAVVPASGAARAALPAAASVAPRPDAPWSAGYALVVLDDGADLDAARELVQARGGAVALLLPPRHLTGWIPPTLDSALVGRAGIRAIHRGDGAGVAVPVDPAGRAAVDFFGRAVRGELDPPGPSGAPAGGETRPDSLADPRARRPDAWPRGDVSELEIAANLSRLGIVPPRKGTTSLFGSGTAPSLATNSDFMTGTVSVTLFFVESDGSGTDPDVYDWTPSAEQAAFDGAAAALSWWASQAQKHSDCWVVFRLEAHWATQDPRCSQWREPALHPSTDFAYVVQQVLGNFGYTVGGHLARASAFDAAMRIQNQTDWAYCAFVAANPGGPHQFTDGYSAWGYVGGPYLALLQNSYSWTLDQVFAHESGHMFRACDEYYSPDYGGCTGCDGCADTGVPNGNCEFCNLSPASCMMRGNNWALCNWTAGQVGWWRAPCTDWAYPAPRVDAASPADLVQGLETDVLVHGDFFSAGSTVDFGADIDILSQKVLSDSVLQAHIHVPIDDAPGDRSVIVTGPDGQQGALAAGLHVRATPRHYVSRVGGNVFPFDRPERAATDLTAVLAASSTGDTVLLAGGTYGAATLSRRITILGGWSTDFGSRAPQAVPSILDPGGAGPALQIEVPGISPVLDGLVLRGGHGAYLSTPELGPMPVGGALVVIDCAPTLRGCRFEASQAGDASTPGAGGGAFFWRANPRLENCEVRGNQAARGAGLFFLASNAVLQDVVVEANDGGGAGLGGGIAALASRVDMHGGRVAGNFGAWDGGGLHADGCPDVRLARIEIDGNSAVHRGGGLMTHASRIEASALRVTRNQSGERGGGWYASSDSLALESSVVAANTALNLAGGLQLSACRATLLNVTVADNAGGPAGGIFWTEATIAGVVRSCIVAGNVSGGLVMGAGAVPLADYNLFADNDGNDRAGIAPGPHDIAGDPRFASPATLDFKLTLGSPALDTGDPEIARADPDGSTNDRGAHGGPHASPPAPARVLGVGATSTNDGVRLIWQASREPSFESYVVFRDSVPNFLPAEAVEVARLSAPITSWTDPDAPPGSWYEVVFVDSAGHASGASIAAQPSPPSDAAPRPGSFALHAIAPNPANPGAWIDYELPAAGAAQLAIFTARGARVRVLQAASVPAGRRRLYWDGRDARGNAAPSGVYWVRLTFGSEQRSRKLVVVR